MDDLETDSPQCLLNHTQAGSFDDDSLSDTCYNIAHQHRRAMAEKTINHHLTDQLSGIAEGGTHSINTTHNALAAIRDYLIEHGRKDGKSLTDDLYKPPYGWTKDTSRTNFDLSDVFKGCDQSVNSGFSYWISTNQFGNARRLQVFALSLRGMEIEDRTGLRKKSNHLITGCSTIFR